MVRAGTAMCEPDGGLRDDIVIHERTRDPDEARSL
jgi:hypothetical protein